MSRANELMPRANGSMSRANGSMSRPNELMSRANGLISNVNGQMSGANELMFRADRLMSKREESGNRCPRFRRHLAEWGILTFAWKVRGLLANWGIPALACGVLLLLHWGCPFTPPEMFAYRAVNDECNCQEFKVVDRLEKIGYLFRASYAMDDGIVTHIGIEFTNNSRDTLFLERGAIKVASNNFNYQYNNRFLPLPALIIPPNQTDSVRLVGKEIEGKDDWNKIAGEQLRVTIQGLRVGSHDLRPQTVIFVPENPKLRRG